jgi:Ca-activated chloride channel homolog
MNAHVRLSFCCIAAFSLCFVFALNAQDQKTANPSEIISVIVSVLDPINRPIIELKKENFRIYEDKAEQTIAGFSRQNTPISLGIIWDVSPSMLENNFLEKAKTAVERLLSSRNAEDECFLITFSKDATLQPIAGETLKAEVPIRIKERSTSLYDAIYMGLDRINRGKHDRKVLIIVSDGQDNHSRHSESEVRKLAKESDVAIYGIMDSGHQGYLRIMNIVNVTGGRIFTVYVGGRIFPHQYAPDLCAQMLQEELQNQYLMSYTPTNNKHDGKWRKITVKLNAPSELHKLTVRAREGRFAPKN